MDFYLRVECRNERQAKEIKTKLVLAGKKYHTSILDDYNVESYAFYSSLKEMYNADPVIRKTTIVYKIADLTNGSVKKPQQQQVKKEETKQPVTKTEEVSKKQAGIEYYEGMSVNKFLRANPKLRNYEDLRRYFSDEGLKKAQYNGVFEVRRGKIIF